MIGVPRKTSGHEMVTAIRHAARRRTRIGATEHDWTTKTMRRPLRLAGAVVLLFVLLVGGLYAYRSLMLFDGRTPEGFQLLTPMPNSAGFEPAAQPRGPVLANRSASGGLAVDFGYKVGSIAYSYALTLDLPRDGRQGDASQGDASQGDASQGEAEVTARHANRTASSRTAAVPRWDEPRQAYAVALTETFDTEPKVPALCFKAVVGPSLQHLDLAHASICIAQRDMQGQCHPETLACGLIR